MNRILLLLSKKNLFWSLWLCVEFSNSWKQNQCFETVLVNCFQQSMNQFYVLINIYPSWFSKWTENYWNTISWFTVLQSSIKRFRFKIKQNILNSCRNCCFDASYCFADLSFCRIHNEIRHVIVSIHIRSLLLEFLLFVATIFCVSTRLVLKSNLFLFVRHFRRRLVWCTSGEARLRYVGMLAKIQSLTASRILLLLFWDILGSC